MSRWATLVGIALVTLGFGLFFWAREPSLQPEPVIRIALFQAPASVALDSIKSEFEKAFQAHVEIELLPYADLQSKIEQQFRTGASNYDVIMVDCIFIPAYASRGMFAEVHPGLWTLSDFRLGDLMPVLDDYLSKYPKGGKRFGMPFMSDTHMMAYRPNIVAPVARRLGLDLPGDTADKAWTWDEYLKVAEAITAARKNGQTIYGTSLQARAGAWIIYEWYSVLFGFVKDASARITGLPAFGPDAARAMDYYRQLYAAAPKAALTWGHEEETAAMCSAVTAMDATSNVELAADLLKPNCSKDGELHFAFPPIGSTGMASPDMGGYGLLLMAQSAHKDLGAEFILWAASPDVHRRIVLQGGSPIRNSETSDPAILAKYPYLRFYPALIESSVYRARIPRWLEMQDVLSRELVSVMKGETASDSAVNNIRVWINKYVQ